MNSKTRAKTVASLRAAADKLDPPAKVKAAGRRGLDLTEQTLYESSAAALVDDYDDVVEASFKDGKPLKASRTSLRDTPEAEEALAPFFEPLLKSGEDVRYDERTRSGHVTLEMGELHFALPKKDGGRIRIWYGEEGNNWGVLLDSATLAAKAMGVLIKASQQAAAMGY